MSALCQPDWFLKARDTTSGADRYRDALANFPESDGGCHWALRGISMLGSMLDCSTVNVSTAAAPTSMEQGASLIQKFTLH